MYIIPDTNIRVLKNCPLDKTYDHTIFFTSRAQQTTYFQSLTKHKFEKQSYARVQRGMLRLERKAEDLYDCNYLMFQNTSFGEKWFYAFITGVEYVNNVTSEITFEIDVMQTWFFDYTLEQCYVEREHVLNDAIGANLLSEPVELGEYTFDDFTTSGKMDTPVIVLASNVTNGGGVEGGLLGGIYTGVGYKYAEATKAGAAKINEYLSGFKTWDELVENVVSCFMYYKDFISTGDDGNITNERPATYQISKNKHYSDIDGYIPRNNKLFTHPYNYLLVTTDTGESFEGKYEYFSTDDCTFNIIGDVSPDPQVMCEPRFYKGCTYLRNERLTLAGFPQCTFNIDAFKAWLAQTASNPATITNTANAAISGAEAGGAQGAAISAAISMIGTLVGGGLSLINPPEIKGTTKTSVSYASGSKDFYFFPCTIRADFAKRIDDFLDVYGYKVNQHKIPNRNGRAHWNYVKNGYTNIKGSLPADDMAKVISIYNRGITFWNDGNEIGNYSLNNYIR